VIDVQPTTAAPSNGRTAQLAITARGITKRFRIYHRRSTSIKHRVVQALSRKAGDAYEEFNALDGVNLDVPRGQCLGILGRNGAGKSTLLRVLARVMEPEVGVITMYGRVSSLLSLGAGFRGELSGRRNIYLYGSLLGLSHREVDARIDEIVAFAELERFIDNPVRHYSSGMYARLAYAVGAHIDADVLLFDEVLAVGDVEFTRKCLAHIHKLKQEGRTILFVSHASSLIEDMCDRAILLSHGRIMFDDIPSVVTNRYNSGSEE
jgi:ABC-type polysaccharide/polyol phosphate transport system ATPase subunit